MKKHILTSLTSILLLFTFNSKATICQWSGPAMGNWSDPTNWSCGLIPGASDTVQLMGQSLVLNDLTNIRALILIQDCTISGSGTLIVSGKIDIKAGGNQTFLPKIISNGTLEAQMATLNFNERPFLVAGTATFAQCKFWMNNGGTFEIAQTGVATFQGATNFFCFNPYYGFVVRGVINKTGASNMDFESLYAFKNATVNIQSGYLVNYYAQSPFNCAIDSTTINIAAGAFLRIERTLNISHSVILGPGKIWIGIGQCSFIHPNTVLADIEQRGGACSVTNGVDTLANYALLAGSMNGVSQIKGNLDWNKGNMTNSYVHGFTNIFDSDAPSSNQKMLFGSLTVKGGGKYTGNDQLSGTINIPVNAVFTLDANPSANFKADLQIFGTLQKLNPDAVSAGFVVNNGRIEGLGKISATVISQGTLSPGIGAGTGMLSFNGSTLQILDQNKIEIQVANTSGLVSTDLLNLIGGCKLGGSLILSESGIIPPGDYIVVQASDFLTGNFSQLMLPPGWEMIQNPFNITVRKLPAPPEAHFSIPNGSGGCAPAIVQFVDASTGDGLSYNWIFPGGNPATSTDKNPTVEYAQSGNYSATLTVTNALGSSSSSSDFTLYATAEISLSATICAGDSIFFAGQYLSLPGVYQQKLQTVNGCDSIVNQYLLIQSIDVSVTQTDSSLTANANLVSYQWLNCIDFSPVQGATAATFIPSTSGAYAVIITQDGCRDTSACFPVTVVGTTNLAKNREQYRVFPNPATDFIQLVWNAASADIDPDMVLVFDMRGVQKMQVTPLNWVHHTLQLDASTLYPGTYFLVLVKDQLRYAGIPFVIGQ